MNFIINSFFNSVYFDNLNFFIAKKILKIFKIFFIQTNLKDLPNKNYIINENQILKEFEDGKRFLISKPYITYSHLIDLMTVMNRKSLSFFDYGAGNLNLYFYLSNKFTDLNYYFYDQSNIIKLLKDFNENFNLKNLIINTNISENKIDLVYFGSTLQYLKNYKDEITKFRTNSNYLLISQTPFFKNKNLKNEFIILKQVNMHPNIHYLYSFNYYLFIEFMKKNNFILVDSNLNKVTKFLNFKNFRNEYKDIDMYDLLFKKI